MRSKIRLLIVSEPGTAGVKRHVIDLLTNIDLDKFEVNYVYSLNRKDGIYIEELNNIKDRGIKCYEAPMVRGLNLKMDFKSIMVLKNVSKVFNPHLIHVHSSKASFLVRVMKMFRIIHKRVKIIFTPNVLSFWESKIYYPIEKILAIYTDILLASSKSEKKAIEKKSLIKKSSLRYIYLAIRKEEDYPKVRNRTSDEFVVAACGRICKQKRPLLFFQIAKEFQNINSSIKFKWIGDFGANLDRDALLTKKYLEDNDLKNTEITGWVENSDQEIKNSDLFCMFSRYESFGYVTVDAMMMKVPVIALNAMGTKDHIINNETGWICSENILEIKERIASIMNNAEGTKHIVSNAKTYAKNRYSLDVIVKQHEDLFFEISDIIS